MSHARGRRFVWAARIAALVAVLAGIVLLLSGGRGVVAALVERVRVLGAWGSLGFIGLYAAATVAMVPGTVLTLAAGAIFGLLRGTVYALAGATLGATLAFGIARHAARGAVHRYVRRRPGLSALEDAVAHDGARIVLLLRLSPVFPFVVLNYALGLTPVRWQAYVAASVIGMAPGTLAYAYAGHVAERVSVAGLPRGVSLLLLVVGLLATVALTAVLAHVAGRVFRDVRATPP